jgi:thiamine-monophosphate kinase
VLRQSFPSFEYKLLQSLKPFLNYNKNSRYPLPIGDDAAIRVCGKEEKLILTADTFVQDVHFSLSYMTLEEIGYKAMAINLSDCAAMAALPDGALVQVVFPGDCGTGKIMADMKKLYKGFNEACKHWDFPVIGGNLSKGPCWMIDITLIGRAEKSSRFVLRTGAKNGDGLWVSGWPGEAGAGLAALQKWGRRRVPAQYNSLVMRHVRPSPRIALGRALGKDLRVHALIDISDGISKECRTLAYENNLGILLDDAPACVSCPTRQLARHLQKDWRGWFLHGGEDYELLFAAAAAFDPSNLITSTGIPITRIGVFSRSFNGAGVCRNNRGIVPLKQGGWDHCRKALP